MEGRIEGVLERIGPLLIAIAVFGLAMPVNVSAATITVPDDYPTIQQAINAATAGDTVYVRSGTYYEHVTIGKSLVLQGADKGTAIISGSGTGDVISITTANVTISGFTVHNGNIGINIVSASNARVDDCIIKHHYDRCIWIRNSSSAYISNCDISDAYCSDDYWKGWGLHMDGNPNSTVENVKIFDCMGGRPFCLYHSSGTVVNNVEIFNNSRVDAYGLFAGYGSYQLENVHAHDNGDGGIYLNGVYGSSISNSLLCDNGNRGLKVTWYSRDNAIRDNVIRSNKVGVSVSGDAYNNHIYHNDIINNADQVGGSAGGAERQTWDNGYPSGGNYWSDYTGSDVYSGPDQDIPGSDGIGDTPYVITINPESRDNYPRMRPFRIKQLSFCKISFCLH